MKIRNVHKSEHWLRDVSIGPSHISQITEDTITFRGTPLIECVNFGFERVCYLLLEGESEAYDCSFAKFEESLRQERALPQQILDFIQDRAPRAPEQFPTIALVETVISLLALYDRDAGAVAGPADFEKSIRLIAKIPTIIAQIARLRTPSPDLPPIVYPDKELNHSANFLKMLTGKRCSPEFERIFDMILVLYAEHGFAASTLTARIVASTGSDLHSAVTAAVCALKGYLHGGANQTSTELLLNMHAYGEISGDELRLNINNVLATYRGGGKVPGFGNPIHKTADPRVALLKEKIGNLAPVWEHAELITFEKTQTEDRNDLFAIADEVERLMRDFNGHNLHPNLDFPTGVIFYHMGIERTDLYPAIFAAARTPGWCAHFMEHIYERNPLMRPRGWFDDPAGVAKDRSIAGHADEV